MPHPLGSPPLQLTRAIRPRATYAFQPASLLRVEGLVGTPQCSKLPGSQDTGLAAVLRSQASAQFSLLGVSIISNKT